MTGDGFEVTDACVAVRCWGRGAGVVDENIVRHMTLPTARAVPALFALSKTDAAAPHDSAGFALADAGAACLMYGPTRFDRNTEYKTWQRRIRLCP